MPRLRFSTGGRKREGKDQIDHRRSDAAAARAAIEAENWLRRTRGNIQKAAKNLGAERKAAE